MNGNDNNYRGRSNYKVNLDNKNWSNDGTNENYYNDICRDVIEQDGEKKCWKNVKMFEKIDFCKVLYRWW
jgi:hypothetical protein